MTRVADVEMITVAKMMTTPQPFEATATSGVAVDGGVQIITVLATFVICVAIILTGMCCADAGKCGLKRRRPAARSGAPACPGRAETALLSV